ncbi:MAG: carboxypeptidase regulatory-like domain-containing protein [Planctomycetota bacterium]
MVLTAVAVTVLVWLGLQLAQDGTEGADSGPDSGDVLTAAEQEHGGALLPRPEDLADRRAPGPLDAPADPGDVPAPVDADVDPEDYPKRDVAGRVVIADDGTIPDDLALAASWNRPSPEITEIRQAMSGREGRMWFPRPSGTIRQDRLMEITRSDVDPLGGVFEMQNVPHTGAFVHSLHEHLYVDPLVRLEGPGREVDEPVEVRLVLGARVRGIVTDPEGTPLEDVGIGIVSNFDPWMVFDNKARMVEVKGVETGEDGRFDVLRVPAGMKLVLVAAAEDTPWQPVQVDLSQLQPGEDREVEVSMVLGASIAGTVVDVDGQPVPGARVALQKLDISLTALNAAFEDIMSDNERTDGEGRFAFTGLPDGAYKIVLSEDEYRRAKSERIEVEGGDSFADLVIVAESGLTLTGVVLDQDDEPVNNAWVQARKPVSMMDWSANMDREHAPDTRTDGDGAFSLAGFDKGSLELRVRHPGFETAKLDVKAGDKDLVVRLEPTTGLSGIVVSLGDGEPVTDFTVAIVPAEGLFNLADPFGMEDRMAAAKRPEDFKEREDGTFEIHDIVPGDYNVIVTGEGFASETIKGVEIGPEGRKGLVVMLPPEGVITGMVVDARTGAPVEGAAVSTARGGVMAVFTAAFEGGENRALTDDEGRFRLAGLGSEPVSPSVQHEAFREHALPSLTLAVGETRDIGLVRLSKGGTVYGYVRDAMGRGEEGVMVLLSDTMGKTMKRDSSDATGAYRIEGLGPGTFNVMRMDFTMEFGGDGGAFDFMKDMVFNTVTIEGDEEQRVDLETGSSGGTLVRGLVRGVDGPVQGAMVTVSPASGGTQGLAFSGTNSAGEYELTVKQPGEYIFTVIVMDEGMAAGSQPTSPVVKRVTIGGSPEQRQDVMLPGGSMHGVVESAEDGKRVPGVRVLLERTDEDRVQVGAGASARPTRTRRASSPSGSCPAARTRWWPAAATCSTWARPAGA